MKKKLLAIGTITCLVLPSLTYAAVTTVSGGVSTGYEYFDREYENSRTTSSSDDDDYSRFKISPFVTIVSETVRQSAKFTYAPTFWYDFDESEDDLDHRLTLDYTRALTRHWDFSLSDNLTVTDEFNSYSPTIDSDTGEITSGNPGADSAGDTLQDDRGRRRYTNNSLSLGTSYMYFEDSTIALNYSWTILRNDSDYSGDDYQDYDKHAVDLTVAHRINSSWKATTGVGYTRGMYDDVGTTSFPGDDDDLDEYRASFLLDHELSTQHSLSGAYRYNQTDYDSNLQNDSEIHDFTFGWGWRVSPKLDISLGVGPTYSKIDGSSGDWNSNENFSLNYRLERGSVGLTASHGISTDNFDGTNDRGNNEFWQLQSNVNYSLYQYTTVSGYVGYYEEDPEDNGSNISNNNADRKTYSAGCSINQRFLERYVASLSYGYVHNTSDDPDDEYDDNRVAFSISYENDFFQW